MFQALLGRFSGNQNAHPAQNGAQTPMPLVEKLSNGKIRVNQKAGEMLSSLGPVKVITVAGPARTGKSFLLNCIASSVGIDTCDKSFDVGNTTEACTRGIWMWGASPRDGNPNEPQTLLLDTEGHLDRTIARPELS